MFSLFFVSKRVHRQAPLVRKTPIQSLYIRPQISLCLFIHSVRLNKRIGSKTGERNTPKHSDTARRLSPKTISQLSEPCASLSTPRAPSRWQRAHQDRRSALCGTRDRRIASFTSRCVSLLRAGRTTTATAQCVSEEKPATPSRAVQLSAGASLRPSALMSAGIERVYF